MLKASLPLTADIMVHFDTLNKLYGRIVNNLGTPLHLCHAADCGQGVLNNKYSLKTVELELYQLAFNKSPTVAFRFPTNTRSVMHPTMCVHDIKSTQWERNCIGMAVKQAVEYWVNQYKLSVRLLEPWKLVMGGQSHPPGMIHNGTLRCR